MGIENIAFVTRIYIPHSIQIQATANKNRALSPLERIALQMAKSGALNQLRLIAAEPDFYLSKLRYAMDFIWANRLSASCYSGNFLILFRRETVGGARYWLMGIGSSRS